MLVRFQNKNKALFQQCDSFLRWGSQHAYHWFWGIVKIKPQKKDSTLLSAGSIEEELDKYQTTYSIKNLQPEIDEYRQKNPISRLFIWLFNYNNLYKKNILFTYYELKTHAQYIKSEMIRFENASFGWEPAQLKFVINICHNISNNISVLSYRLKRTWSKITDYLVQDFKKYEGELNNSNSPHSRHVYKLEQVKALQTLNISARIGSTFSETIVKQNFRVLAKNYHVDKGGKDEKFREIQAARDLLLNKSQDNTQRVIWHAYPLLFPEDLMEMYEARCVKLHQNSLASFEEKLDKYLEIANNYEVYGHTFVQDHLGLFIQESQYIITEYEIERRKTFAEYIQIKDQRFGDDGLSFEFYQENINRKLIIKELKDVFDGFLTRENQILQGKKRQAVVNKYLNEHTSEVDDYCLKKQEECERAGDIENANLYRLIKEASNKAEAIKEFIPVIYANKDKANQDANINKLAYSSSVTDSLTSSFTTSLPLFNNRKSNSNSSITSIESDKPAMSLPRQTKTPT